MLTQQFVAGWQQVSILVIFNGFQLIFHSNHICSFTTKCGRQNREMWKAEHRSPNSTTMNVTPYVPTLLFIDFHNFDHVFKKHD